MTVIDAPPVPVERRPRGGAVRRLTSARLGVRLARRELRRRPGRTVLVLLLVFLPTAVMGAVVTGIRTTDRSLAEEVASVWGRADGGVILGPSAGELDQIRSALPGGSRVLVEHQMQDRVRMGDRRTYVEVNDVQLDDPIGEGRFGSLEGRLPQASGEAVLSTDAASGMGVDVGDTFTPDRLGTALTVVGIIEVRAGHDHIVYTPGPVPGVGETRVSVDLPPGTEDLDGEAPTADGSTTLAPVSSFFGPEENETVDVFWSYVGGGVGLVVLGTVITAAFAVGARRQLRSVGLLSSSGASPSTVKWFLVAQGAVAGLVGSIVGVTSAVLALRAIPADVVNGLAGRPIEGVTVRFADLLPIVVIGTLAASIAAWLPARSAARVPTLQALAGRRPLPKVPRRLPVLGALSVGGGCALLAMAVAGSRNGGSSLWALVAVLGGVAVLLGAIATAPWVIAGLERASGGLPRSWRLAGRSLARSRVRSSAVVGAVCAVSATLIAGATLYNSLNEPSTASVPFLRDDQVAIETYVINEGPGPLEEPPPPAVPAAIRRQIAAILPDARTVRLLEPAPDAQAIDGSAGSPIGTFVPLRPEDREGSDMASGGESMWIGIATEELLDLLAVSGALRAELDGGGAIAVTEPPYDSRAIELSITSPEGPPAGPSVGERETVALAGWFESPSASHALPVVLVSAETAERLGFEIRPGPRIVLDLPAPVTDRQRDRLQLLNEDLQWELQVGQPEPDTGPGTQVLISTPEAPAPISPAQVRAAVLAASLLLVLAVVAVGLALAAKDSEDERQVLVAVGAPPRTLRRSGALQAVLLVLVAGIISIPAGLLPAAAIVAAADVEGDRAVFRPDLSTVLFAVVLVPVLVGIITWSGSRLRDLVRPKRPDVFAFGD